MVSYAALLPPSRSNDSGPAEPLPLGPSCVAWFCLLCFCRLPGATTYCGCCLRAARSLPGLLLLHDGRRRGCAKFLQAARLLQSRGTPAGSRCHHGVLHRGHASRQPQHRRHHHSAALHWHRSAAVRCRRRTACRLAPIWRHLHIARPQMKDGSRSRDMEQQAQHTQPCVCSPSLLNFGPC